MTEQPGPPEAPSVEDANNELLAIQAQMMPYQIRAAFLQGVIAGRQAVPVIEADG